MPDADDSKRLFPSGRKPGRPPLGDRPMSGRERMRRSRAQLTKTGGHYFAVRVEGMHWDHVEAIAQTTEQEPKVVLKELFEAILDRLVGMNNRAAAMAKSGASEEEIAEFYRNHVLPKLPDVPGERITRTSK